VSSSSAIAPIPTRYAGCHFRSRLEARWAVFFDALGVAWEYEPQGFEVGPLWCHTPDAGPLARRRMYLPDFYLTNQALWVEVKGNDAQLDRSLLLAAMDSHNGLPWFNQAGLWVQPPSDRYGDRLLILGPIPRPSFEHHHAHSMLYYWNGYVFRHWNVFLPPPFALLDITGYGDFPDTDELFATDGGEFTNIPIVASRAGEATPAGAKPDPRVIDAYTAARSARFEHGQSGA
jgi:hypothetical protein